MSSLSLPLRYTKKDDLIQYLGFNEYKGLERFIKDRDGKCSLTTMKKMLADEPETFSERLNAFIEHVYHMNYIPAIEKQNSEKEMQQN